MKNFKLYCAAIALTFVFISQVKAVKTLECGGDYRVAQGQKPAGSRHKDIERTGVVLCKDYGKDKREVNDRFAVILGHDKNMKSWMFQAGKVENKHQYTSQTAAAELCEETGGLINYTPGYISKLPYIYFGKKQLFFLRDDNNSSIGVRSIKKSCRDAINDPNLPSCMQEIDDVAAVSVNELLRVAGNIHNGLGRHSTYTLTTRTAQKQIEIDGFYMRMIANQLNASKKIFNNVFGVSIWN